MKQLTRLCWFILICAAMLLTACKKDETDELWTVADMQAFEEAFESGEYDQVRALFTDDGVLTTASNIHEAVAKNSTENLADRVGENEFRRLSTLHGAEDFQILGTPVQVGDNTVTFAWAWDGGSPSGTALLHLREGKIVICILNPSQYSIPFTEFVEK